MIKHYCREGQRRFFKEDAVKRLFYSLSRSCKSIFTLVLSDYKLLGMYFGNMQRESIVEVFYKVP